MSILYACVARGAVVLAQASLPSISNGQDIAKLVLAKIDGEQRLVGFDLSRGNLLIQTYIYGDHRVHFHALANGITFLCITDESASRAIAFSLLSRLQELFSSRFSETEQENAPVLSSFNADILDLLHDPQEGSSRTSKVKGDIEDVKNVMVQNIERVLERGERIDLLVDKTDSMNQTAFAFRTRSTALRRRMWWKNTRLMVLMVITGLFLLYIFIGFGCGLPCKWRVF